MNADAIRSRNAGRVVGLYEAEQQRDIEKWAALWAENGRHTFWLSTPTASIIGRDSLVAATQHKFDVRPPYRIDVTAEPLADPARVLARLHLTLDFAQERVVDIWCLFHFDDDGLITEIEEIVDTANSPAFPQ